MSGPLTRAEIRRAADNILDRPSADPDDDAAILARFTVRYLDGPSPALDDRSATMRWTALEAVRSLVGDHDIHKPRHQDCAVCRLFLADAERGMSKYKVVTRETLRYAYMHNADPDTIYDALDAL